ncbi:MAG: GreA/GreB family elongation factor [Gemmatimonadota bacterium]
MLDEIREKLEGEIEKLTFELNVTLPEAISKAVELGDLRENSEYKSALERQQFVQARISQLTQRMSELSKIDVTTMPMDRVGFGSRVQVEDVESGESHDFTLVAGDFMDLEAGHISIASPIGNGLMGARMGEEIEIQLPRGSRAFKVKELQTLPQQLGLAEK